MRNSIPRLKSYSFSFEKWSAGSLANLGLKTRFADISENACLIQKYAIGFLEGEKLSVRPKNDCVGVMFFYDGVEFWTHLTLKEFNLCFPDTILFN